MGAWRGRGISVFHEYTWVKLPNKDYNLLKAGITLIFSAVQAYLTQPFSGVFHSLLASEAGIAKTPKTTKMTGKKISLILNRCLEINDVDRNVFRASTGGRNGSTITPLISRIWSFRGFWHLFMGFGDILGLFAPFRNSRICGKMSRDTHKC